MNDISDERMPSFLKEEYAKAQYERAYEEYRNGYERMFDIFLVKYVSKRNRAIAKCDLASLVLKAIHGDIKLKGDGEL